MARAVVLAAVLLVGGTACAGGPPPDAALDGGAGGGAAQDATAQERAGDGQVTPGAGGPTASDAAVEPTAGAGTPGGGSPAGASPGDDQPTGAHEVVTREGVMVPVPEGWRLSEAALDQGVVAVSPELAVGERPEQYFVAGPLARSPLAELAEGGFDDALEGIRATGPGEPDADEPLDVRGAVRARMLRYDALVAQEGAPPTTELVVLAADGAGGLWLFSYSALPELFEAALADLFVSELGIDAGGADGGSAGPAP